MTTEQLQRQPAPFEIFDAPDAGGARMATNGQTCVSVLEPEARLFRRRGITGISAGAVGDLVLPQLNALAGELLANPALPDLAQRLQALSALATPRTPQRVEWVVAELDGVRVYVDGDNVVVTRRDLTI